MARFAKLGIGPHGTFDAKALSPEMLKAVQDGMADAWAEFKTYKETELDTGKRTSADAFGTREFLHGDYLARFSGAVLGIYGNSKDEAIYPVYFVDSAKKPLSGANRYELRFAPGDLPPVNAFWSLTLYELPSSLLSANPLNRYLINSAMLPSLKRDDDGGVTLAIQHADPGADGQANWLPAPTGPFLLAMRLYWPKADALDGKWIAPPLVRVSDNDAAASAPAAAVPVTPDNFVRAESDRYLGNLVRESEIGKLFHRREPAAIDNQTVIRLNRDTLYSSAVFDLDAGPVTITLPDAGKTVHVDAGDRRGRIHARGRLRRREPDADQGQDRNALCRGRGPDAGQSGRSEGRRGRSCAPGRDQGRSAGRPGQVRDSQLGSGQPEDGARRAAYAGDDLARHQGHVRPEGRGRSR